MNVKRHSGFTMIEIIIAVTVAIILLAAVHSTVQAMTQSAQRIQDEHAEQARLQRFVEILRRDLQGWYEKPENTPPIANASVDQNSPFLRFTTTTDGLGRNENFGTTRACEVQYILRRSEHNTEVIRRESSISSAMEIVVLSTPWVCEVVFFKNDTWIPEWSAKERPSSIQVKVGELILLTVP